MIKRKSSTASSTTSIKRGGGSNISAASSADYRRRRQQQAVGTLFGHLPSLITETIKDSPRRAQSSGILPGTATEVNFVDIGISQANNGRIRVQQRQNGAPQRTASLKATTENAQLQQCTWQNSSLKIPLEARGGFVTGNRCYFIAPKTSEVAPLGDVKNTAPAYYKRQQRNFQTVAGTVTYFPHDADSENSASAAAALASVRIADAVDSNKPQRFMWKSASLQQQQKTPLTVSTVGEKIAVPYGNRWTTQQQTIVTKTLQTRMTLVTSAATIKSGFNSGEEFIGGNVEGCRAQQTRPSWGGYFRPPSAELRRRIRAYEEAVAESAGTTIRTIPSFSTIAALQQKQSNKTVPL